MKMSWLRMHTAGQVGEYLKEVLGLPQMRELSTSRAYIDHQIRLAISPIIVLETP